jgi:uncharacterized protein (TIGR03435 family)
MGKEKRLCRFTLVAALTAMVVMPLFAVSLLSQTAPAQKKASFEVVSIKPRTPGTFGGSFGPRGNTFSMSGATLRTLLMYAYRGNTPLLASQIISAPNWWETERFDLQAKADCSGGPISGNQLQLMVQSLLEDRFQLKAHLETRELPMYNLVVGKDGPKIKRSEDQTPTASPAVTNPPALCGPPPPPVDAAAAQRPRFDPNGPLPRGSVMMSGRLTAAGRAANTIQGSAVGISTLVNVIVSDAGRPVIDKTGLTDLFDFRLEYGGEAPAGFSGFVPPPDSAGANATASDPTPTLTSAIQQLGLKLESTKGPLDVLVIESVQKPTEN